jgi:regulator of sirC expression with transglutaminase-like and TPR domain
VRATGVLVASALLLVALGIWLVWPQEQKIEIPAEAEEEEVAEEPEKPPVAVPVHRAMPETAAPGTVEPAPARDQTEMLRVMEEVADNRQALKDWDRKLLLECRKLINEKKFEEARQCLDLRLARNPDEPAIYLERGILHAHMGKLTEAYWDYTKFLELAPDSRDAPRIRAILEKMEAKQEEP